MPANKRFGRRKDGRYYVKGQRSINLRKYNEQVDKLMEKAYQAERERQVKDYALRGNSVIAPSSVHGRGIFASKAIHGGDEIVDPPDSPGFNHSYNPNAMRVVERESVA